MSRAHERKHESVREAAHAFLVRATLWLQRRARWVPAPLRDLARSTLARLRTSTGADAEPVDEWSTPLFDRGQGQVLPEAPQPVGDHQSRSPADTNRASAPREHGGNHELHCLVVTGALDAGGMEEVVAFLARHLPAHGIATTVMHVPTKDGDVRPTLGHVGRTLEAAGVRVVLASRTEASRWLAEHRPDVISAHGTPLWVLETAVEVGIPFVETLHSPEGLAMNWRGRPARSRGVTALVAVSDLIRRQYLFGDPSYPSEALVTIPNAVDEQRRPAVDRVQAREWLGIRDEFLFVSLARHALQKNSYGLVQAFADVARARPSAHLLIAGGVGDRAYAQQVRMLRDRLPEGTNVHLRQNSPHPSAILAAADAFVLDSFFEGWPLAPMEALVAGLPVVMSEVGGAREQVGDDRARGYIVPNPLNDPDHLSWEAIGKARFTPQPNKEALVAAMTSVVDGRERWAAARQDIATEAVSLFDAERCVQGYADVLARTAKLSCLNA